MNEDKKVLVTGASGGIGRAIAVDAAKAGYYVICHYCGSQAKAEETLNQIKEALKNIFKCPVTTYNMTRKLPNGKINSNYEEFMKYATLKTKGKENVEMV